MKLSPSGQRAMDVVLGPLFLSCLLAVILVATRLTLQPSTPRGFKPLAPD